MCLYTSYFPQACYMLCPYQIEGYVQRIRLLRNFWETLRVCERGNAKFEYRRRAVKLFSGDRKPKTEWEVSSLYLQGVYKDYWTLMTFL
jgi:hypothetical protein